MNLWFQCHPGL